ncbi:MAG: glycosyltransferase family 4 protein [Burkholderiales bacterium]
MRVTHVNFARGFRGGERQTLNLIEGLAEFGVGQTLICRSDSELKRRVAGSGVAVMEVSHPLLGHLSPPRSDVIHVHEARGAYWAAIEHACRKTRYIITRRIPNPISNSGVTACVYRHAAKLLGVSQDVSRHLSNQTGLAVQTILSSVTAYSADPDLVLEIRKKLGGGPVIGHIGALHDHHKGQSVLIEAFHAVLADYPEARLLLVGEGPDRACFESLAKGDKRIVFAGFQREVGSWIAAMDIFCFPSREEGLGSSVLDAMALGVPVVASAVGGLPELIGRNERGLLVDDHDPASWCQVIRRMLADDAMRNSQLGAARQFARENSIAAMSKSYLALYDNILACQKNISEDSRYAAHVKH